MSDLGATTIAGEIEGGCLCSAIRYRLGGAVTESAYCHCSTCQRQSGAPVVAWFAIAPSQFAYTKGKPKSYRASSRAGREFCGECGTYLLFREDDASATLGVNTATLDDPAKVPPAFHIWHQSHISWFDTADKFPRHAQGRK
ncbi:MAG: GFA family protein [Micropepsaceae bacterium]